MNNMSVLPIYKWEMNVMDIMAGIPHDSLIYRFFYLCSHWPTTRWIVIAVFLGLIFSWGPKKTFLYFIPIALAVALSDLISYHLIKSIVMRARPNFVGMDCTNPACWGFVSSHASNICSALTIIVSRSPIQLFWALPIAFCVCFSRLVLNDHFPLDIIGGAILGLLIGFFVLQFLSATKKIAPWR